MERHGAEVLVPQIQDAVIPTPVYKDLSCRMDALLQQINILMSDRRIMAFPGKLNDVSFSANKVKSTGEKKSNLS